MVLTLALLLRTIVSKSKEAAHFKLTMHKQVFGLILSIVSYITMISLVGYVIATVLFIFGVMWYLGMRQWSLLILTPILTTLTVYLIFSELLFVMLPAGLIFGG